MSIFLFGLALLCFSLAMWMYSVKRSAQQMQIGNIWKTKFGDIVIITDLSTPDDNFMLKCTSNGDYCEYNTLGVRVFGMEGDKFKTHIGTLKDYPEYLL